MKQPVRGTKKSAVQPAPVIEEKKIIPKISERTIRKKREARERRLKPGIQSSYLGACGVICLYVFLALCIVIGAGGIAMCIIFFDARQESQVWKIVGIVLGAITCLIALILILISIFKQTRNRSQKLKEDETLVTHESFYDDDLDDAAGNNRVVHETRETASSPIVDPFAGTASALPTDFSSRPEQLSMAIQTEENATLKNKPQTVIDRSKRTGGAYTPSHTPPANSIVYRRVPIPTAKVVVQQPTTKMMIVRVPDVAGELILQAPRRLSTNEED